MYTICIYTNRQNLLYGKCNPVFVFVGNSEFNANGIIVVFPTNTNFKLMNYSKAQYEYANFKRLQKEHKKKIIIREFYIEDNE